MPTQVGVHLSEDFGNTVRFGDDEGVISEYQWVDVRFFGEPDNPVTRAAAVQAAIAFALDNDCANVFVPAAYHPYDASLVTFDASIGMVREGQIRQGDVVAYGADPAGVEPSSAAIQAAIDLLDYAFVPPGRFLIDQTIFVGVGQHPDFGQQLEMDMHAVLAPATDITVLDVLPIRGLRINGGTVDLQQLPAHAGSAVLVRGTSNPIPGSTPHSPRIQNLSILGRNDSGFEGSTGLHLRVQLDEGRIHTMIFHAITIHGFDRSIDLVAVLSGTGTGTPNINGNIFSDITISRPDTNAISIRTEEGVPGNRSSASRNHFLGVNIQTKSTATDPQIFLAGTASNNTFTGVGIFDMLAGFPAIQIEPLCRGNIFTGVNLVGNQIDDQTPRPSGRNSIVARDLTQFQGVDLFHTMVRTFPRVNLDNFSPLELEGSHAGGEIFYTEHGSGILNVPRPAAIGWTRGAPVLLTVARQNPSATGVMEIVPSVGPGAGVSRILLLGGTESAVQVERIRLGGDGARAAALLIPDGGARWYVMRLGGAAEEILHVPPVPDVPDDPDDDDDEDDEIIEPEPEP